MDTNYRNERNEWTEDGHVLDLGRFTLEELS